MLYWFAHAHIVVGFLPGPHPSDCSKSVVESANHRPDWFVMTR